MIQIRMLSAVRLEGWLNSGKLWRCGQELLAYVCVNCDAVGATAARDQEVLGQLAKMRLKTKPLQNAYQACLRYEQLTVTLSGSQPSGTCRCWASWPRCGWRPSRCKLPTSPARLYSIIY